MPELKIFYVDMNSHFIIFQAAHVLLYMTTSGRPYWTGKVMQLADGSLLINGNKICSYQQNDLMTLKDADQFIDFAEDTHNDRFSQASRYLPLPDKSGYLHFVHDDICKQSTLYNISNQFEIRGQLQLSSHKYYGNGIDYYSFKTPNFSSHTWHPAIFSNVFACITECEDKFFGNRTFRLHIVNTDLTKSYKTILHKEPKKLLVINNQYIAVVCKHKGNDYYKISIELFNLLGKQIKKIIIDKEFEENFIDVTPDGDLVTCSKSGEISIHHIMISTEKLKKETESVLIDGGMMPSVLIPIITDYAGLFSGHSQKLNDGVEAINYSNPAQTSGFSRLKKMF